MLWGYKKGSTNIADPLVRHPALLAAVTIASRMKDSELLDVVAGVWPALPGLVGMPLPAELLGNIRKGTRGVPGLQNPRIWLS